MRHIDCEIGFNCDMVEHYRLTVSIFHGDRFQLQHPTDLQSFGGKVGDGAHFSRGDKFISMN